jgi:hypothetical protein
MTAVLEELRARRRQKPFLPFVLVLKDGRRFVMKRPLQYGFSEERVVIFVQHDRDEHEFFPPSDIATIESAQPVG